jgi:hypothetical protein
MTTSCRYAVGSSLMAGITLPGPGRGGGTGPATRLGSARSRRWSPVSRASAQRAQARGRQHVGVLVVPVAGGEVDDGLVGQLGGSGPAGVQCGRPPASCWRPRGGHRGHHTKSDRTFGDCTAGQLPNADLARAAGLSMWEPTRRRQTRSACLKHHHGAVRGSRLSAAAVPSTPRCLCPVHGGNARRGGGWPPLVQWPGRLAVLHGILGTAGLLRW